MALCLLIPQWVFAHFHYDLKVESQLQANEQQQLSEIQMTWIFDYEVSSLMLKNEKDIETLGERLINDLVPYHYFTKLKLNNQILETTKVSVFKVEELIQAEGSKLKLSFTLPLRESISLKDNSILEFIHKDPSASAVMSYESESSINID